MPDPFKLPEYDLVEANSVNFTEKATNAEKTCVSCKFYRQSQNGCFLVDATTSDNSGCDRHEAVANESTPAADTPPAAEPEKKQNHVSLGQGEVNHTKEPTESKPEDTVSANGDPAENSKKMPASVKVVSPTDVPATPAENALPEGWHNTPAFLLGRITGMEEIKAMAPRMSMNRKIRKANAQLVRGINSRQQEVWDKLHKEHGISHGSE